MIDAKRNLVEARREMIIDFEGISWICLNTRNEKNERLYSDGVYTMTKDQIKNLSANSDIPDGLEEADNYFLQ